MGLFKKLISAISPVGGMLMGGGGESIDSGVRTQESAMQSANRASEQALNQARQDLKPYTSVGKWGIESLQGNMPELTRGFTMKDFQMDPGYQFRMAEGGKAIDRSAAARGGLNSGRTLKALSRFGQDMASQEYGNAFNRFQMEQANRFNRLNTAAGYGMQSQGLLVPAVMGHGRSIGQNVMGYGNASAAAGIAKENQQNQMLGQLIGAGGMAAMAFSDKRVKKNIKPINKKDLKEFRAKVKPYIFEYKDKKHGKGKWAGVMAQDLEKTKIGREIVEEVDGVKMINIPKIASLSLAALAMGE